MLVTFIWQPDYYPHDIIDILLDDLFDEMFSDNIADV
jgi:hypothetical protein